MPYLKLVIISVPCPSQPNLAQLTLPIAGDFQMASILLVMRVFIATVLFLDAMLILSTQLQESEVGVSCV